MGGVYGKRNDGDGESIEIGMIETGELIRKGMMEKGRVDGKRNDGDEGSRWEKE